MMTKHVGKSSQSVTCSTIIIRYERISNGRRKKVVGLLRNHGQIGTTTTRTRLLSHYLLVLIEQWPSTLFRTAHDLDHHRSPSFQRLPASPRSQWILNDTLVCGLSSLYPYPTRCGIRAQRNESNGAELTVFDILHHSKGSPCKYRI